MLVLDLMLLYPAEEVNVETGMQPPPAIQKNIAVQEVKAEKEALLPEKTEKAALPPEKVEKAVLPPEKTDKPVQEKEKAAVSPPKELKEREEAKTVSRNTERKTAQVFEATAYCSCVRCCGKSDGITKSGVKVHKGTLAVDPKVIPLGSKVYIEGMGWFIAEDTGNFSGRRVDIYMETHEKALQFGRRNVNIIL